MQKEMSTIQRKTASKLKCDGKGKFYANNLFTTVHNHAVGDKDKDQTNKSSSEKKACESRYVVCNPLEFRLYLCYMLAFIYNRCDNIYKRQILLNYTSPLDGCNMSVDIRNEIWFYPYKTFCMPRVALTVCGVSALLSVTTQPSDTWTGVSAGDQCDGTAVILGHTFLFYT